MDDGFELYTTARRSLVKGLFDTKSWSLLPNTNDRQPLIHTTLPVYLEVTDMDDLTAGFYKDRFQRDAQYVQSSRTIIFGFLGRTIEIFQSEGRSLTLAQQRTCLEDISDVLVAVRDALRKRGDEAHLVENNVGKYYSVD